MEISIGHVAHIRRRDNNRQALGYFYCEDEPDRRFGGQAPATNAKERLRELIDRYADAEAFDGDEADGPAGNGFGGPH